MAAAPTSDRVGAISSLYATRWRLPTAITEAELFRGYGLDYDEQGAP